MNKKMLGSTLAVAFVAALASQGAFAANKAPKKSDGQCCNSGCSGKGGCAACGSDCAGKNSCKGHGAALDKKGKPLAAKTEAACKKSGGMWVKPEAKKS